MVFLLIAPEINPRKRYFTKKTASINGIICANKFRRNFHIIIKLELYFMKSGYLNHLF